MSRYVYDRTMYTIVHVSPGHMQVVRSYPGLKIKTA